MAVALDPYSARMGLFTRRLVAPPDVKDYLDAATGVMAERLTMIERTILDKIEASDRAASDQHARMDQRMEQVERGMTNMGERVGALEQQHERDVGREQAKEQIMVPWLRGVVMPLTVLLIALLVGAGATTLIVRANEKAPTPATPTAENCKEQVSTLIANRALYTRRQYVAAAQELASEGCAVTAALSRAP